MHKESVICPKDHNNPDRQSGFTLIELMLVVALLVSFVTVGIPALASLYQRSQLSTAVHQLNTQLLLAKSSAINTGSSIILCRSADSSLSGCAGRTTSGNRDWSVGTMLFQDVDGDMSYQKDQGDRLIKAYAGTEQTCELRGRGDYLAFDADGLLRSGGNGTFTATCGNWRKQLVINTLGRSRLTEIENI